MDDDICLWFFDDTYLLGRIQRLNDRPKEGEESPDDGDQGRRGAQTGWGVPGI
jgi:hypothetical protein